MLVIAAMLFSILGIPPPGIPPPNIAPNMQLPPPGFNVPPPHATASAADFDFGHNMEGSYDDYYGGGYEPTQESQWQVAPSFHGDPHAPPRYR